MKTFLKQCKWGQFLLLQGDMISRYVDLYGEWSETEVTLFQNILECDSNVIEVGANIGMHSIPLSRIASQGKVICFEPQRTIFQVLSANCALNNRTNIFAEHLAVGNKTEYISIQSCNYDEEWNYGAYSIVDGYNTEAQFTNETWAEEIRVTRLDDHQLAMSLDSLQLLKIDVEGLEIDVIEGAKELIKKHRPCLFVENNNSKNGDALIKKINSLNYDSYWFISERFKPQNYNKETYKTKGSDYNMLCFPAEEDYSAGTLTKVDKFSDLENHKVSYVT